eukprot:SAG31_NODE_19646_length_595_cov_1.534274_1_plen_66_part_10
MNEGHGRAPGKLRLLGGPVCQWLPPRTGTEMNWHTDGDYIRMTYTLDDLHEGGGGTAIGTGMPWQT